MRGVNKVFEGHPHCVDSIENNEVDLVVNTTDSAKAIVDSHSLRRAALLCRVSYFTTMRGARAAVEAIAAERAGLDVASLQHHHARRHERR